MAILSHIVREMITLRGRGVQMTLLAVCPNSDAVLEAAIKAAAENHMPMLFAATLNQVDRDGGYTGWTPRAFVARMRELAAKYRCPSPLYPCLDHGGPWLKDAHARQALSLQETMAEVKATLTACLKAGYALLHIDTTVDQALPEDEPPSIDTVVDRAIELIAYAESERERLSLPPISYEVGSEEVHGGLVDLDSFDRFLTGLRAGLESEGLGEVWPCFIVAEVGTDLHTTTFDPDVARRLYEKVAPLGSSIKGHYTDWVENPVGYPATGMGGANVGPEFTATEVAALRELCDLEGRWAERNPDVTPSGFEEVLRSTVVESNRWRKWLTSDEAGLGFDELTRDRQGWLVATGARYVWTNPRVERARRRLYENVQELSSPRRTVSDPNAFVVDRVAQNIQAYVDAFNLKDSLSLLPV